MSAEPVNPTPEPTAAPHEPAATPREPLLKVRNLNKEFRLRRSAADWAKCSQAQRVYAVEDVSFDLSRGHTLGVAGESGSGKTTLVRCLIRLIEPDAGSVEFAGIDVRAAKGARLRDARRRMQMVFQDPYASLNPRLRVGSAILEAGRVHHQLGDSSPQAFTSKFLELVQLPTTVTRKYPRELSGGQRQRVAIARALAVGPEILIADEAVSALDVSVQAQLLNLFQDLKADLGLTMIFVAHQLSIIAQSADHVAIMFMGRIVEQGPVATVFGDSQHPYTRALLAANPQPNPEQRLSIEFKQGSLETLPRGGCQYRLRCAYAEPVCENYPPLDPVGPDHRVACIPRPFQHGEGLPTTQSREASSGPES